MSDRIQKIAMLIFALAFIAIFAILNTSITTIGTGANSQLSTIVTTDDSALSIYDNKATLGETVINCAKSPSKVGTTIEKIFVVTAGDTSGEDYSDETPYKKGAATAAKAINSNATFQAYLCYNKNDVCTGVLFIQTTAMKNSTETIIDGDDADDILARCDMDDNGIAYVSGF